ncbi:unnamed protein product [Caretta caretta]
MAAAGPAQLQVAFEDVALYFTREEWELLSQPEKQLYRDQMLRNYRAFVSLGYSGSTPDLIHQIESCFLPLEGLCYKWKLYTKD